MGATIHTVCSRRLPGPTLISKRLCADIRRFSRQRGGVGLAVCWGGGDMLKLKHSWVRALTITGQASCIPLAPRVSCSSSIDNSISPLYVRSFSRIITFSRSLHSSISEDDDYSELGSPVPKVPSSPRKLMTEKPEPYKRTGRTKKGSAIPSESSISLKDDCSKLESSRKRTKSFNLPIGPLVYQDAVTIRITNISSETTDSVLHSMCMSCGSLEGLVRTEEDAVDALFSAKGNLGIPSIIRKLNQTSMNDHRWSANIHPRDSAPVGMGKQIDANCNFDLGLDMCTHLADLRRQITVKKVLLEDLEYLHNSLLHLEAHPHTRSSVPNND